MSLVNCTNTRRIIQFNLFCIEGFTICTHTTSLTFDLTSDQEKLPKNRKKTFTGKKGRTLQESDRGGSLSRMDRSKRCHVTRIIMSLGMSYYASNSSLYGSTEL